MSLERFINRDSILENHKPQFGKVFNDIDMDLFDVNVGVPKISKKDGSVLSEIHVYSFNGDYLGVGIEELPNLDSETGEFFVDVRSVFHAANIEYGSYKLIINLFVPALGNPLQDKKFPAIVKEISSDKTEIKFSLRNKDLVKGLDDFSSLISQLKNDGQLNNLTVNFGNNVIYHITNFKRDSYNNYTFYVKTYEEISDDIENKMSAWFGIEVSDPKSDTVILTEKQQDPKTNKIKGPRFSMDVDQWDSKATTYKNWNELLDTDVPTTQRLIDSMFSGSAQATLNIDYTDFNNFVHFSSAKDRLANFKEKIKTIESYEDDINTVQTASGSGSITSQASVTKNQRRIDVIKEGFDPFERWLYYNPTGSIFTHDITGSLEPYPKYDSGSHTYLHSYTSSIATTWYSSSYAYATNYDQSNYDSLWWSIPEHISMDPNNSDYTAFVNMVGQHFDVLHSYIKALTKIHEKDEHPERGPSPDLLYFIGKSFGWNLQNARATSDLWKYFLGSDESGSYLEASSSRVIPYKEQTQQIWRRTVNNLPYLLKTKGTSRSVKALMSVFGIPNSVLSIKEYGGPGDDDKDATLSEERYSYKLHTTTGSYVEVENNNNTKTYEFRIGTDYSGSSDPMPIFSINSGSYSAFNIDMVHTASVSGSNKYGYIQINSNSTIKSSSFIPIFDNDLWTIRIYDTGTDSGSLDKYRLEIARADDGLRGRIPHSSSIDFYTAISSSSSVNLGNLNSSITLGYTTQSYDGYVQSYKEYSSTFSYDIFKEHVKNPGAYYTNTYSSSYYDVIRYHPLGFDQQREDRDNVTEESSSHPNQDIERSTLSYVNFPSGSQSTHYESQYETHYIKTPELGNRAIHSEKIRLEDISLKYNLSPENSSIEAEFDDKPIDTKRLAIVFSLADQINRDIFNHMGYTDLDQFIGSPLDEWEGEYNELRLKRKEYFKKYQQVNKINDFINILALYDYTFFEQIKQLTPGRADLISGILIEPHVLERNKQKAMSRPTIEDLSHTDKIQLYDDQQTASVNDYESEVNTTASVEMGYEHHTSSYIATGSTEMDKLSKYTSSIDVYPDFTASKESGRTGSTEVIDRYTGFTSSLCTYITQSRYNDCYKEKEYLYTGLLFEDNLIDNALFLDATDHWFTGSTTVSKQSGDYTTYSYLQYGIERYKDRFDEGYIITGSNSTLFWTTQSFQQPATQSYALRIFARPLNTGSAEFMDVRINNQTGSYHKVRFGNTGSANWVNDYRTYFTILSDDARPSGSHPESYIEIKAPSGSIVLYSVELFKYQTTWKEAVDKHGNMVNEKFIGNVLHSGSYQITECEAQNRLRFVGSKLTGPGINVDSDNTLYGDPVVIIKESNPNRLSNKEENDEGNLRVE